jgi:hypothetical protein
MNKNFIYAMFLAAGFSMTACDMDSFNEQDAINAQKELLTLKYTNETELEKLRNTATTALEQLKFTNLLEQMRLEYQLKQDGKAAAEKEDYTVFVTDMNTNQPLANVDVSVASEGQVKVVKTNAAGIAIFENLALHSSSRFIITKEGYTAASITEQGLSSSPVKLLNIAEANRNNTIQGKLYIETDLTNTTLETVPANTLVKATTSIGSGSSQYTLEFPTRTDANGNYSLKLPDAPGGEYHLVFGNLSLDQKLYVNGTEADGPLELDFPNTLPRIETVKTQFSVENSGDFPSVYCTRPFYLKLPADILGNVGYSKVSNSTSYSPVGTNGEYQLAGSNIYTNFKTVSGKPLKFEENKTLTVQLVDFTGQYITKAPKLVAFTDNSGQLQNHDNASSGNSYGYVDFQTEDDVLVEGARGVFKSDPADFVFNYATDWDDVLNPNNDNNNNTDYSLSGGQTLNLNFTYGHGYNRANAVY